MGGIKYFPSERKKKEINSLQANHAIRLSISISEKIFLHDHVINNMLRKFSKPRVQDYQTSWHVLDTFYLLRHVFIKNVLSEHNLSISGPKNRNKPNVLRL